jgi:hypothetical protein
MGRGKAGGGEQGSAKREWESEDGMLPLDHFEGDVEITEEGHGKIVRQDGCKPRLFDSTRILGAD